MKDDWESSYLHESGTALDNVNLFLLPTLRPKHNNNNNNNTNNNNNNNKCYLIGYITTFQVCAC
jgi:hypothetical protein